MTILGDPARATRPTGYLLLGGQQVPITSFQASFSVGNIPLARVGILPEFLSQLPTDADNQVAEVHVGDGTSDHLVFRGYVSGENSRASAESYGAGVDLIHLARDLDEMRLSAPSLHAQGCNDWSYQRQGSSRVVGGDGSFVLGSAQFFSASKTTPLARQVIDELVRFMQEDLQVTVDRGNPAFTFKTESLQPAIDLLKTVRVTGGGTIRPEIATALSSNVRTDSINGHLVAVLNDSLICQRSIWDALTAAFSDFGLTLLCDNAGNVFVVPDLANFKPPEQNLLDGDYLLGQDQASSFYRRVGEVVLISRGVALDPKADAGGDSGYAATVTSWPPPGDSTTTRDGATLSLQFPGWLSPISYVVDPKELSVEPPSAANPAPNTQAPANTTSERQAVAKAQLGYAQMLFNLEADKRRTFSCTGPFAPLAVPGTTVALQPYSQVQARSSGATIAQVDALYYGYLYQVRHDVDVMGKTLTTSFAFRNVSRAEEGLALTDHPIFTDAKPFVLQ